MAEDIPSHHIVMTEAGKFKVKSQSSHGMYMVSFGGQNTLPSCQCLSWQQAKMPCKHFFAIFLNYPAWGWDQLPSIYRNSVHLVLDDSVIKASRTDETPGTGPEPCVEIPPQPPETNNRQHKLVDTNTTQQEPLNTHAEATECKSDELQVKKGVKLSQTKRCRDVLEELRKLTYIVQDPTVLQEIERGVKEIVQLAKTSLPKDAGLILEERCHGKPAKKNLCKKRKCATKTLVYKQLPKSKKKHKFSGRHGSRAQMMRDTLQVHVPVKEPTKKQSNHCSSSITPQASPVGKSFDSFPAWGGKFRNSDGEEISLTNTCPIDNWIVILHHVIMNSPEANHYLQETDTILTQFLKEVDLLYCEGKFSGAKVKIASFNSMPIVNNKIDFYGNEWHYFIRHLFQIFASNTIKSTCAADHCPRKTKHTACHDCLHIASLPTSGLRENIGQQVTAWIMGESFTTCGEKFAKNPPQDASITYHDVIDVDDQR